MANIADTLRTPSKAQLRRRLIAVTISSLLAVWMMGAVTDAGEGLPTAIRLIFTAASYWAIVSTYQYNRRMLRRHDEEALAAIAPDRPRPAVADWPIMVKIEYSTRPTFTVRETPKTKAQSLNRTLEDARALQVKVDAIAQACMGKVARNLPTVGPVRSKPSTNLKRYVCARCGGVGYFREIPQRFCPTCLGRGWLSPSPRPVSAPRPSDGIR